MDPPVIGAEIREPLARVYATPSSARPFTGGITLAGVSCESRVTLTWAITKGPAARTLGCD
jgi:hypothetical protein